ncbi:MAG TPA: FAD-dependent oxidoreductase [Thermoanaerobaculia bacterium]|nr:FAD-dependent oxidoreductase [Thermoanaerobaculia bacterium]
MSGFTRRHLIGTGAALGASFAFRLHAAPRGPSVVVIGAGAFGGWTALQLVRRGARVTLVDAWGPGNARASSGDETRVIRSIYGASHLYTGMSLDSLVRWRENERRWGKTIFHRTGALWMLAREDSPYETKALPLLREMKVPFEELSVDQASRRWPQVSFGGVARVIHEPEAGYLEARRGCEAVFESFMKEGGHYRVARATPGEMTRGEMSSVMLDGTESLKASRYVFACGAWISRILPLPKATVRPTRQEVFYFGTPGGDDVFGEAKMPVWIDDAAELYYGIPGNSGRGFKVACDTRGPLVADPTTEERRVSDTGLAAARAMLAKRFPLLSNAPLVDSRVCQYENSPDENFILDRHPNAANVWIAAGGSGHGYKHGPMVGEIVANAVLGKRQPPAEFSLARFEKGPEGS